MAGRGDGDRKRACSVSPQSAEGGWGSKQASKEAKSREVAQRNICGSCYRGSILEGFFANPPLPVFASTVEDNQGCAMTEFSLVTAQSLTERALNLKQ